MTKHPPADSLKSLVAQLRAQGLSHVDARQWRKDWRTMWVSFADLIAFASRNLASPEVVLNNIVRFGRASAWAQSVSRVKRVYRFSDSTFALSETAEGAIGFSVALQHACLAMSVGARPGQRARAFTHTITPRITIAHGPVLWLPERPSTATRLRDIDARSLVAGAGVVAAYALEKHSAGGLITVRRKDLCRLRTCSRGINSSTRSAFDRFLSGLPTSGRSKSTVFMRGDYVDIPWLMLRPIQDDNGHMWVASKPDADYATESFLGVWELGIMEQYSDLGIGQPLDVAKHYAAALRHGIQTVFAMRGEKWSRYHTLDAARERLKRP